MRCAAGLGNQQASAPPAIVCQIHVSYFRLSSADWFPALAARLHYPVRRLRLAIKMARLILPAHRAAPAIPKSTVSFAARWGGNQIIDTRAFSVGPLTNIEFAVGADLNTYNTTLGSAIRA